MILTIYLPHTILPINIKWDLDLIIRFSQKFTFVLKDEDKIIFSLPIIIQQKEINYYFIEINDKWREMRFSCCQDRVVFDLYYVIAYYKDKRLVSIKKNNTFKCITSENFIEKKHPPILLKLEITKKFK